MKKFVRKKKSIVKKVSKKPTMLDLLPKNDIERLELMIRMTEKRINPNSSNCIMKSQSDRLKLRLEEIKKSKLK